MSINYIQIHKFCELSGYTEHAVNAKIQEGVWVKGKVWVKAPDGRRLISVEGYNEWVEVGLGSKKPRQRVTRSPSPIEGSSAANESSYSPPPLTSNG